MYQERTVRKVVVQVSDEEFDALDRLADLPYDRSGDSKTEKEHKRLVRLRHSSGAPRYAEIVRVLLVGEILGSRAARALRVAVAVLSNSTMVLAASMAQVIDAVQADLRRTSAAVSGLDPDDLPAAERGEPYRRNPQKARHTMINLTLDSLLHKHISARAREVSRTDLQQARLRSETVYVIRTLLEAALDRADVEEFVGEYAISVAQVRKALEATVEAQREIVHRGLRTVRPLPRE